MKKAAGLSTTPNATGGGGPKTANLQRPKRLCYNGVAPMRTLGTTIFRRRIAGLALAAQLAAGPAQAVTFDPNRIFTDAELFTEVQPSVTAIQRFLEREGSVLATFRETTGGVSKTAAQIVHDAAVANRVSAKFLLAKVEKEKGLLTKKTASEADLNWATGYSCTRGSCNDKYKGFTNQVESAAITQAIYRDRAATFSFRVGATTQTYDGISVTPANQATANLYIYTPYTGNAPGLAVTTLAGGNYLFWKIWNRYFTAFPIPDGTVVTSGGVAWRIEGGRKRRFASDAVRAADYRDADLTPVSEATLAAYPEGTPIALADNTVVRNAVTLEAFLVVGQTIRPIENDATLAVLSDYRLAVTSLADVPAVPAETLAGYTVGAPITAAHSHPQGRFYQLPDSSIIFVQDTLKHAVDPAVWAASYAGRRTPVPAAADQFADLPLGSPLPLADGTLVRDAAGTTHVISDLERRKIEDATVASRVFGSARVAAALSVPDGVLQRHQAGLNIDYMDDTIPDAPAAASPVAADPAAVYAGVFAGQQPEGFTGVTGQTLRGVMRIRNTGTVAWVRDGVWLTVEGSAERFALGEGSVAPGSEGSFAVTLTAPDAPGLAARGVGVHRADAPNEPFLKFGRFVLTTPGVTSRIERHNLPVALRRAWKPVTVNVTIKNTGKNVWVARKTALKLTAGDGTASPFYDPADWVRRDVPAVPVNRKTIAPGETGVFTFTLKPTGLARGVHTLRFSLERTDTNEAVLLSGEPAFVRQLRVD